MNGNKGLFALYFILTACLAFALGYLLGSGSSETIVRIESGSPYGESTLVQQKIELPASETSPGFCPGKQDTEMIYPLDLNTADSTQLEKLPGIGPELAGRIVAYRENNGSFIAVEQIMDVTGIGEKKYEEMKDYITVGGTQ